MKSVEILHEIDPYEITQISDALHTKKIKTGETIIKQDEQGDCFYMLEEGEAYAEKVFPGSNKPEVVKNYEKGSYFGELALVKNEPRAASVIAKTDCKLLVLDRPSFKRLIGPLENILRRNFDAYTKYIKN